MTDDEKQLKEAYEELEAAIKKVITLEAEGAPGLLIEWVLTTACQYYEDEVAFTRTQIIVPVRGDLPHYRLLGLIEMAACQVRADVIKPDGV